MGASAARVLTGPERSILAADLRARGFSATQVAGALAAAEALGGEASCLVTDDGAPVSDGGDETPATGGEVPGADDACLAALRASLAARGGRLMPPAGERGAAGAGSRDDARGPLAGSAGDGGAARCCDAGAPGDARRLGAGHAFVVKWVDAAEEAAGIAAFVRMRLSGSDLAPGDVFVAVPSRPWERRVVDALARAGLPASIDAGRRPLPGDPRDAAGSMPLRAFAALGLAANPRDAASWRTWCAVGRADLASPVWNRLENLAASRAEPLVDVLASLSEADPAFEGARHLAARHAAGMDVVAACARRRGALLANAADPAGSPAFRALVSAVSSGGMTAWPGVEPPDPSADAARLFALALERATHPSFAARERAVRVGALADLPAADPRVVVIAGMNDGLYEDAALSRAFARPCDQLLASYVQRMPADVAARAGARVRRTRREGTGEVALLAPAPALAALGAEAPSTMGGQQFCAAVLGVRP